MRVVCPTMHAEHLHLDAGVGSDPCDPDEVAAALDHLHRSVAGTNRGIRSARPIAWFADHGHEIAMHTHHHLLQGEPGHTTGFLMGQPLDDSDIHRCLQRELRLPRRAWTQAEGFVSGNWLVLDQSSNGCRRRASSTTPRFAPIRARIPTRPSPNEPRATVSRLGDLVEIPTTSTLKQQLQADLTFRRRSVDVGGPALRPLLPPRLRPRRRQEARRGPGARTDGSASRRV